MARPPSHSAEDRLAAVERAHALIAEGHSVHRATSLIAQEMGVSATSVWNWARQAVRPLVASKPAAAQTAAAIQAHVETSRARRARVISRAFDAIEEALEVTVDPAGIKDLAIALGIAIDKARLEADEATERTEKGGWSAQPSRPEREERGQGRMA